jgi:hypothetical protein
MRKILLLYLSFTCMSNIMAQDSEYGFFIGGAYYIGDLNSEHFSQQNWAVGGIYRHHFKNERVVFRLNCIYGHVQADDKKSGLQNQINRNLSFRSSVLEIGPLFEVNFFPYKLGQTRTDQEKFGTPYFFGGITYLNMNPKAQLKDSEGNFYGEWQELQPLATEGKKQYSLSQISMPVGIGVKLNLSQSVAMSFEYGIRKTFTDYLDDVSGQYAANLTGPSATFSDRRIDNISNPNYNLQRGNPNDKDWYSFWGMMITFRFNTEPSCPTWQ